MITSVNAHHLPVELVSMDGVLPVELVSIWMESSKEEENKVGDLYKEAKGKWHGTISLSNKNIEENLPSGE